MHFKYKILIGVSAQSGAFSKTIVEEMAKYTDRPIISPLSNPTSKAECTPEEPINWTGGKAIVITRSTFDSFIGPTILLDVMLRIK